MNSKPNKSELHLTLLMPQGPGENPFPMSDDPAHVAFLQTVPAGDEGRALVRRHRQNVFLRTHGQSREVLTRVAGVIGLQCARLETESERMIGTIKKTDQQVSRPKAAPSIPKGRDRWRTLWWGLVLIAMACFTFVHAA